jgi:hypothetical protein
MPEADVTSGNGMTLMLECRRWANAVNIGKNADAGITFFRHSGIYPIVISQHHKEGKQAFCFVLCSN